jgi:hypothetical protein
MTPLIAPANFARLILEPAVVSDDKESDREDDHQIHTEHDQQGDQYASSSHPRSGLLALASGRRP